MASTSLTQHKYYEYTAYGVNSFTPDEKATAKKHLEDDKKLGRYQEGYPGIVAAVVKKDDKYVLLYHLKRNSWVTPVGKIEPDETDEEALIREMKEELDIKVTGYSYLGAVDLKVDKGDALHFEIYCVNLYSGEVCNKEPHKHARIKYCTRVELAALIKTGTTAELLEVMLEKGWF